MAQIEQDMEGGSSVTSGTATNSVNACTTSKVVRLQSILCGWGGAEDMAGVDSLKQGRLCGRWR
jgi:hypothetical protein